ncbi:5' exonuclease Apollo [Hondaea fermentalgiana]|uniref:Protein artemis n=1 Tax=Hondaea fermentalgiana TaxID=2315210 RepID=A0A2R5G7K0_9STRA|nr:5' exonuclease Apollo [Hondaea fermentalgiana]|eukprot:GBG26515.1 5' exonuclease Apollo [Hondaea fermentalgiana]
MDGRPRIEGTNIIFDYFGLREEGYKYFLSHAHMDHMRGLNASWNWGEIYCSHETKAIVSKMWPELCPFLMGRDMEEAFDVILDAEGLVSVQVRMLDAYHCLGSAVFVIDGFFGRAVYTGDFRAERALLDHDIWREDRPVDYLFLDNTLHASSMPQVDRAHWRELLCDLVRFYPSHTRFEVGIESLGKEEVLESLAKALDTKVIVSRARFEVIRDVSELDISYFVHNEADHAQARIKVVSRQAINERRVVELNANPSEFVVCILLQASGPNERRQVRFQGPFAPETLRVDDRVRLRRLAAAKKSLDDLYKRRFFIVPYTLHASRYELANFVRVLRPHIVTGIVSRERKGDLLQYITRWRGQPSDDHVARLRRQWDEYKSIVVRQAGEEAGAKRQRQQQRHTQEQQREDLVRLITKARVSRKNFDTTVAIRKLQRGAPPEQEHVCERPWKRLNLRKKKTRTCVT